MTAETATNPVRDAIAEGQQVWTQAVMVSRETPADLLAWELERAEQDLYRAVGIETLLTRAEIEARYRFAQDGPFSMDWEEDEDGELVRVPLERARSYGYHLRLMPRRHPLPGAVYVARQPLEGEQFSIQGMKDAFNAIVGAHDDYPKELRLSHQHYTDYCNLLVGLRRVVFYGDDVVRFNGVPVKSQPRAPLMTLLAVYPLPGIGG